MTVRKPMMIGPFSKGLNTFDDPTAVQDTELVQALNFDMGLDGSLRSRPPFVDMNSPLPIGSGDVEPHLLGYYYSADGTPFLIASDGDSRTMYYASGAWTLITDTFSATDMAQFDGKAWLVPPNGESDPGGYWTPVGGFVADSDMPQGVSIVSYKSRLWIAEGDGGTNPTRVRYSKVLGQPDFWDNAAFMDVGAGDGQNVVKLVTYFDTMLVFRTKSIWSFQYGIDPASAIQAVIVPGVGLQNRFCLVAYENYLYFMYDEKAYEFINNRAQQISLKVPFTANDKSITDFPYTVNLFNNRVLFSYYETIYVFNLRTRTWTTWRSDVWGSIGHIVSTFVNGETDEAIALPSKRVTSPVEIRRNRVTNPSFDSTADGWVAGSGSSAVVSEALGSLQVGKVTATSSFSALRHDAFAVAPEFRGGFVSSRAKSQTESDLTAEVDIHIRFKDADSNYISSNYAPGSSPVVPDEMRDIVTNGQPVPLNAHFAEVWIRRSGGTAENWYVDDVLVEFAATAGDYFDGNTSGTLTATYGWGGGVPPNAESVAYSTRNITILHIEDVVGDGKEVMHCEIQTKNYSFNVPGSFKVLFWWGVDAIFRRDIKGQVIPVVYTLSTTWGQLEQGAVPWGRVLQGTWRHPYSSDPAVVTSVVSGSGPERKFVKFLKKLRFRQAYFKVSFEVDGSIETAPVQIFTISTYIGEKQTVVKSVS